MTAWTAVVPVKAWQSAKSRLGVPGDLRAELARALTLDTFDVLASHPSVRQVVVVTADPAVGDEARLHGAAVLVEEPADDPLNAAIGQACAWIAVRGDGPTVVVPADLAYLSKDVLERTLASLAELGNAHVPDWEGTGTTLLAASRASDVDPHYGIGSSAEHSAAGFAPLDGADARARADIDRIEDLRLQEGWALGLRVSALLGRSSQSA